MYREVDDELNVKYFLPAYKIKRKVNDDEDI